MKNKLSDLSVILSVSFESKARKTIFEIVLRKLYKELPGAEIIVIHNSNKEDDFKGYKFKDNVIFHRLSQEWSKSFFNNAGAKIARNKYLCFFDADCMVDRQGIEIGLEKLRNKKIKLAFPFKYFRPLKRRITDLFLKSGDCDLFNQNFLVFDTIDIVRFPHGHPGAIQMLSAKTFTQINGYNINFQTWGGTDVEMVLKISRLFGRDAISYCEEPIDCFHLWHGRPPTQWNSTFQNNRSQNAKLIQLYEILNLENYKKAIFIDDIKKIFDTEIGETLEEVIALNKELLDFSGYAFHGRHILNHAQEKIEIDEKFNVKTFMVNFDPKLYKEFLISYQLPPTKTLSIEAIETTFLLFISKQNEGYLKLKKKLKSLEERINVLIKAFLRN